MSKFVELEGNLIVFSRGRGVLGVTLRPSSGGPAIYVTELLREAVAGYVGDTGALSQQHAFSLGALTLTDLGHYRIVVEKVEE